MNSSRFGLGPGQLWPRITPRNIRYQTGEAHLKSLFSFNPFLDVWEWDETLAFAFNMLRPNEEVSK